MFAVPGWSVSADALKSETASARGAPGAKPRKRKKNNTGSLEPQGVTSSNVADLYEAVVEGKAKPPSSKQGNKDSNHNNSAKRAKRAKKDSTTTTTAASQDGQPKSSKKNTKSKNKTKDQDTKPANETRLPESSDKTSSPKPARPNTTSTSSAAAQTSSLPLAPSKLTPLQASMREKLISARFRHLNETLYTRPSEESFSLFQDSPEMFTEYHEGFRRQVKVWPENPVDSFLSDIRSRAKAKPPVKGRSGPPPSQRNKTALPRTMGTCTIADLGCGDARLAESLQGDKSKLRLDIKSFDLQSPSALVTRADIANLPLEDGSVNVAIFCLALMGTNWIDFVEEAYRILHWKGELWVAEIKSRFGPARKNDAVVEHSVGNRKKNNAALSKKLKAARDAEADAVHGQDLAVEVDGLEDKRRETDVTAFVEALRHRGFVLQGERAEAIDLSNRMFVKMHFIKGASPTKGKGVKAEGASKMGTHKKKKGFAPKWDEDEDAQTGEDEASILKPCVYKIR